MICPFRVSTVTNSETGITRHDFEPCYGAECPYYRKIQEKIFETGEEYEEICKKVQFEEWRAAFPGQSKPV